MKRLFTLLLIATLFTAHYTFAQNNTYNMVIKMANGNTITIGSNEVENISFSNGVITASGLHLEEIYAKLSSTNLNGSDDIKNLQTQIDGLKTTLDAIQSNISNSAFLTSVTPIAGGVQIVMSNGMTYTITNGKDGRDGKDGVDGKDGKDGKDGSSESSGIYYIPVPNVETGCYDIYKNGEFFQHTNISFVSNSETTSHNITGITNRDIIHFYGVEGGEGAFKAVYLPSLERIGEMENRIKALEEKTN